MRHVFKSSFLLGVLFVVAFSSILANFQPVYAANTDVQKDKERRSIKALRDCMIQQIVDEDDDIDNYSDLFDDQGRKELVVVGFDLDSDNGVISCQVAVRRGLIAMNLADNNDQAEKYFIEFITGQDYNPGQKINNDSGKILENMNKLRAEAQAALDKTEPPHTDLRRTQVAPLVNYCFTATTGEGTDYSESRGDFKVDGLGTFQQKDGIKWKSEFKWIKPNDGITSQTGPEIGDIELGFSNGTDTFTNSWKQNNSDASSDFFPWRSDVSQSSGYKSSAIVDCHFVKKNKDWIFAKNVTIKDGKAVFTDANGEEITTGDDNADVGAETDEASCNASINPATWAICPIVNGIGDLIDWMFDSFILPLLKISPVTTTPDGSMFKAWSGFRLVANIMLVIVFLLMIFGQAIGGGLVDAYTVKKAMPRLVIGTIGINLSIYLVAIMVDITNVLGGGIADLLVSPFQLAKDKADGGYSPGNLSGVITLIIILLATYGVYRIFKTRSAGESRFKALRKSAVGEIGKKVWMPFLLFIGIPAIVGFVSVFVTLILRTGIIMIAAVTAPAAIALWILPSTEKYFKKWWDLFVKALLVYPIVMILFAMGDIVAYAFGGGFLEGGKLGINGVVAIFAQLIPLFMIGYAFKIAGGILGSIHETVNKRGKQLGEAIKGNPNDENALRNKAKRGLAEAATRVQNRHAQNYRTGTMGRGLRGFGGWVADHAGDVDARMSKYNKMEAEHRDRLRAFGPDDLLYAAAGKAVVGDDGKTRYYNSKGKEIDGRLYKRARQLYGGDTLHGLQSNVGYALEKAQTDEDAQFLLDSFLHNAQEMGLTEKEAASAWQGITYPQKGKWASMKYATPKKDDDGNWYFDSAASMDLVPGGSASSDPSKTNLDGSAVTVPSVPHVVSRKQQRARLTDLHRTRGSYELSQVRDQDWRSMFARQQELETAIERGYWEDEDGNRTGAVTEADHKELLQTYEVFDAASSKMSTIDPDSEGVISAQGTAATQKIITQARTDRAFDVQTRSASTNPSNPTGAGGGAGQTESRLAQKTTPAPRTATPAPTTPGLVYPPGVTPPPAPPTPAPAPGRRPSGNPDDHWVDTTNY